MHRQVNAIAGRLSLRPSQRHSREILHRVVEIAPPRKGADVAGAPGRRGPLGLAGADSVG